jgi:hypothetical protein
MGRVCLALLVGGTLVGPAQAGLLLDLVEVDNSGVLPGDDPLVGDFNDGSYFTFDIVVTPTPGDTWLSANMLATTDGPAVFFQHLLGSDVPPDSEQVSQYPALEFDSYFSTPVGGQPLFYPPGPDNQATAIEASWTWDGPAVDGSSGSFVRVTTRWLGGNPATVRLEGDCGLASTGGALQPFSFTATIPEPGSLLLLAVGALLVARCQR